ncbi:MAG: SH3 domain-containing protein [Alphaproteobacteria bacterium]|nr:SH3 domain-containing protein [Alphaproteobacteria bacterium]
MSIGRKTTIAAIAAAIFALSAGSAFAAPGVATGNVNVRTGPGTGYSKVDTLHSGEQVDIGQCQSGWCYITHNGPDGWVSANYLGRSGGSSGPPQPGGNPDVGISFGFGSNGAQFGFSFGNQQPGWHPGPRPLPQPQPMACFYNGPNYSQQSFCMAAGTQQNSFSPIWNDKIESVRVSNGASVTLCQHANFGGYCRSTSTNEPVLGPWLNNQVSSLRVQ